MRSPLDVVHEYYSAFSTLDLKAIAFYYSEPCMSLGPQGVFFATNRADLIDAFAPFIDGLRAKGYSHSEFVDPEVTMVTDTATLVRGVAIRYAQTGLEIERVPISYLLHRDGANWKIAVMILSS